MDFALTEEQREVAGLAAKIFADHAGTPDALWATLAGAGLIGTSIADDVGGAGHGVLEHCALLAAAGAAAAPVPLWAVTTAAVAIDRFGSPAQRRAILPDVVRGAAAITVALDEPDGVDARAPRTVARDGKLTGVKTCVPIATRASKIVVTTASGLFVIDASAAQIEAQTGTTGEALGRVTMRDTPGEPLGGDVDALLDHATLGLCAMELGLVEQVLRMTAKYTTERVQFDRPIATFQAVAQRAADAYIDVETIRLTLWEAAWRVASGLPAAREIAIAKYFAADAGQRVTYAAQHLHGGIGFDLDYPLAKYYPLSKQIELTLGGASAQLARLGDLMTREG
jgi:alkylation response protein AidB-like acyl-CoA dehydrogenase